MSWQMSLWASTTYKGLNQLPTCITQNELTVLSIAGIGRSHYYSQYEFRKWFTTSWVSHKYISNSNDDLEIFLYDVLNNLTPRIGYWIALKGVSIRKLHSDTPEYSLKVGPGRSTSQPNFMLGWPWISNYICVMNQHDALCVCTVLNNHASTPFGPICSPSSEGSKYVLQMVYVFLLKAN
jgi:hypothetical protein